MKRSALTGGVLCAALLIPFTSTFAAPHGGMGGGPSGAVHSPAPVSATGANPPTNPNARSGNATGQPNQSCQSIGVEPGQASSSPGSPFNEPTATSPGGTGGQHYAGNVPQSQKNTASVAQYDVACANQANHK